MSKIKSVLSPEVAKFISENYPVVKKRTPLWFFANEMRTNNPEPDPLTQTASGTKAQVPTKISKRRIFFLWRKMEPEAKRKYFNMSKFDEVRYEQQRSLWLSKVGELLIKNDATVEQISEAAPTREDLQEKFLESLDGLKESYAEMIQAQTTESLYKDAIKNLDRNDCPLTDSDLLSKIPVEQRDVLTRPRKPQGAYVLFVVDNADRFRKIRKETNTRNGFMQIAAAEWAKLTDEERLVYKNRNLQLKDEYEKAMQIYNERTSAASSSMMEEVAKTKVAFNRSIRKRLRDVSLLPLNTRNGFNFFMMHNRYIKLSDLTQVWRNLPEEQKQEYLQMTERDTERYDSEIELYAELSKNLQKSFKKKKT